MQVWSRMPGYWLGCFCGHFHGRIREGRGVFGACGLEGCACERAGVHRCEELWV